MRTVLVAAFMLTAGPASAAVTLAGVASPVAHTYSIVARDPKTGEMGVAVQSHYFSVGPVVPWAEAGVGAVATQAAVDVGYGPRGMELLKQGMAPKAIIEKVLADDPDTTTFRKAGRQFAVMNVKGELAAYTGPQAPAESGDAQGKYCTAQGNTLGRPDHVWPPVDGTKPSLVPKAIVDGFEKSELDANGKRNHISIRLVAALEGGQAAGGDHRGQESAALIVVKKDCGVWPHNDVVLRLQVDDSPEPIKEMRRLVEKALVPRSGQVPCFRR